MSLDCHVGLRLGTLDLAVDLRVEAGEVLAILGPNGAGKSSTLRAIAGLVSIDDGHITLDGEVLDDPTTDTFVPTERRPIGVVFQEHLLFAHMSVLENVAFGLRARGITRHDARRTAAEWLDRMGLAEYASGPPGALSGGQSQRVALARALAPGPRLLLLDEPLAALDVATRASVRSDLRRHLGSFDGVRLLVTHDPVDAYALADRIAILERGTVAQVGTISEVTAHPRSRYVADLVGTNLVTGTVSHGVLTTAGGACVVIADAQAGPSFAVIRPQAIALTRDAPSGSSARNVWQGAITDIDRLGDRVRIAIDGQLPLVAEITVSALDTMQLRPGDDIHAAAKATDIEAYLA